MWLGHFPSSLVTFLMDQCLMFEWETCMPRLCAHLLAFILTHPHPDEWKEGETIAPSVPPSPSSSSSSLASHRPLSRHDLGNTSSRSRLHTPSHNMYASNPIIMRLLSAISRGDDASSVRAILQEASATCSTKAAVMYIREYMNKK